MKIIIRNAILLLTGGFLYCLIELLFRGRTHPSMLAVGGLCFWFVGLINELIPWEMAFWKQMVVGGVQITLIELISGIVLNIVLKLDVWDYSRMPFNLIGQICLPFSITWIGLSAVAIVLDDYLRYWLFHEDKPRYVWS